MSPKPRRATERRIERNEQRDECDFMKGNARSFDAVKMSQRLREKTSLKLATMSRDERLVATREARERFSARKTARARVPNLK